MRRSRAVLSIFMAGLFGLLLPCATIAAPKSQLNATLIEAVWNNDLAAAQRAIGEGAEPTATDEKGLSAVDIAVDRGFFDIAHYLLAAQNQQPPKADPAAATVGVATVGASPVAVPRAPVETSALKARSDAPVGIPVKPAAVPPLAPSLDRRLVYEEPEPILVLPEVTPPTPPESAAVAVPEIRAAAGKTPQPATSVAGPTAADAGPKRADPPALAAAQDVPPSQIPELFARIGDLFSPAKPQPAAEPSSALDELELVTPDVTAAAVETVSVPPAKPAISPVTENRPAQAAITEETPAPAPLPVPVRAEPSPQLAAVAPQPPASKPQTPTFFERIGDLFTASEPPPPAAAPSSALEELELARPQTATGPAESAQPKLPTQTRSVAGLSEPVAVPEASGRVAAMAPQQNVASPAARATGKPADAWGPDVEPHSNPFTRLTDLILDLLPDATEAADGVEKAGAGLRAEPEQAEAVTASVTPEQTKPPVPSVVYPVKDLTTPEDPYKVVKAAPVVVAPEPAPQAAAASAAAEEARVVRQPITIPRPRPKPAPKVLREDELAFGKSGHLNTPMDRAGISEENCVVKKNWRSHYCIQSFQWAPEMMQALGLPGFYQGGGLAIVHYKSGRSVQYHGLFPAPSFDRISEYLIRKYGEPTAKPEIWTAMLAEPNRQNRVYQWVSKSGQGDSDLVLEIREIDDLRWSTPPDKVNGVIRLYRKGDETIFRLLTSADLLLLQVRKGNDPPSPPPAKLR